MRSTTVEELCVGDLAMALEASEDAVGYGLRILRMAGFVVGRRAGRVIYYRLPTTSPNRCASTAFGGWWSSAAVP